MSRRFLGGGGKKKGGSGSGNSTIDKMRKLSAFSSGSTKDMIADKQGSKMKSHEELFEDMMDEKMFNPGGDKGKFHLPGTKPPEEREMTKGQKMAAEMAYSKKMKKRMKMRAKKIDIAPKSFGDGPDGGRITKDGRVMNNQGRVLFKVDSSTGVMMDNLGRKVGKYNPKSMVNDSRMERLIKKYSQDTSVFNPFAPKE